MNTIKLTDSEVWTLINALGELGDDAEQRAKDCDAERAPSLAELLRDTVGKYKALADKLEDSQA